MRQARLFLFTGALCGFLTVALGAFGAHGLKHQLAADMLAVFNKGVDYQGLHALALLGTGILSVHHSSRALNIAGWSFLVGILLFSGSLYLLAISGIRQLGMVTPFGGLAFLAGWLSLMVAGWRYSAS